MSSNTSVLPFSPQVLMADAVKTPNVVEATNKPGLYDKLEMLKKRWVPIPVCPAKALVGHSRVQRHRSQANNIPSVRWIRTACVTGGGGEGGHLLRISEMIWLCGEKAGCCQEAERMGWPRFLQKGANQSCPTPSS